MTKGTVGPDLEVSLRSPDSYCRLVLICGSVCSHVTYTRQMDQVSDRSRAWQRLVFCPVSAPAARRPAPGMGSRPRDRRRFLVLPAGLWPARTWRLFPA